MSFSNGLSPAEAERLAILAEECGEVIQVIGKILRHGFESTHPNGGFTNRGLLTIEIGHVNAATMRLIDADDISWGGFMASSHEKLKAAKFLHHQGAEAEL